MLLYVLFQSEIYRLSFATHDKAYSEQSTQLEYQFRIYFFMLRCSITFYICAATKHQLFKTRNHNYYA